MGDDDVTIGFLIGVITTLGLSIPITRGCVNSAWEQKLVKEQVGAYNSETAEFYIIPSGEAPEPAPVVGLEEEGK